MTTYNIQNSRGNTVATILVGQSTMSTFPIEMVGQGYSLWGQKNFQNQYRIMENFNSPTAPSNPVDGMDWYHTNSKIPSYYASTQWVPYATSTNALNVGLTMATAAATVNFATAGTTSIFQAPGNGNSFYLTGVVLIPVQVNTVTSPALFNLYKTSSEDILENVIISNPTTTKHAYFSIEGMAETISGTSQVYLEVVTPATATQLVYDVRLFGMVKI